MKMTQEWEKSYREGVAKGGKPGRPQREIDWKKVDRIRSKGLSYNAARKLLEIPESTFWRALKRRMKLDEV
jgi:hypothetical protein